MLLEASKCSDIRKFIQISTDEVYGSLDDTGYFTESSPILPNNPYSASKAAVDHLVRSYHHTYGLPVNFVRFANIYGPSQYPEKLIPMKIKKALDNKEIPIHGQGLSIRDWFFVQDNVTAIDAILNNGLPGEIYNIGAQEERRTIDVVQVILEIIGKMRGLITFIDDRQGQDYRYANDPSKIMNDLDWQPRYNFELGLRITINWYVENRTWWKALQSVG
ncbi:dTDP-glucose 4,6-dehydratase [Paenibacillus hexagrammi]|uniref:GDP-mannose 4,6-dehydratase n=1 Tax=Paenibacillus hexagrammi TaxID=2908839 RepID=A0ABY3SRD3_9BACL|nr:GDP-mannose 4,6-dehydratase [Paenibacillus sp. YPD9-1]UJF36244.1 GDP-mannose 4,6-dehydratase [Paenibacillus sp. YPD9-1]